MSELVQHEAYLAGAEDSHGNTVTTYSAPAIRQVHGWAPTSSSEPKVVGVDRVVVQLEVFSPWPAAAKDRVTIGAVTYEVVGEAEDWNHGPFGMAPGYVINLRRVDG